MNQTHETLVCVALLLMLVGIVAGFVIIAVADGLRRAKLTPEQRAAEDRERDIDGQYW